MQSCAHLKALDLFSTRRLTGQRYVIIFMKQYVTHLIVTSAQRVQLKMQLRFFAFLVNFVRRIAIEMNRRRQQATHTNSLLSLMSVVSCLANAHCVTTYTHRFHGFTCIISTVVFQACLVVVYRASNSILCSLWSIELIADEYDVMYGYQTV